MAPVWYESRIQGRRRTTGAFQGPSWAKVFPTASPRAQLHCSSDSRISRVGFLSPAAGGVVWKHPESSQPQSYGGVSPNVRCRGVVRCGGCLLQAPGGWVRHCGVIHILVQSQGCNCTFRWDSSDPTLLPVQFHLPLGSRFKTSGAAWTKFIENHALSVNSTQMQTYLTASSQWAGKQYNNFQEN